MENLYKQAILDAKAIRAGAIANAKASLEEVMGPKIHELVSLSLQEDLEEEDYNMEEEFDDSDSESEKDETNLYHDELDNRNPREFPDGDFNDEESTLDDILAELESLNEADEADEEDTDEADEEDTDEEDTDEADEEDTDEAPTDDTKLIEITVGDLKSILQSVMGGSSSQMGSDEDLNLDEILAEIENVGGSEEGSKKELEDLLKEGSLNEDFGTIQGIINALSSGKVDSNFFDANGPLYAILTGIPILFTVFRYTLEDEIKNMLMNLKSKSPIKKMIELVKAIKQKVGKKSGEVIKVLVNGIKNKLLGNSKTPETKELNEARKTIKNLSSTLNEVNLLNAKLLYVNKIFTEKTLNESQKIKVIKSFDKAENVKEAKNVYEILKESLNTKQKHSLKESIGFASQTRGYVKNNNIIESDPFVARWQKIAGIK